MNPGAMSRSCCKHDLDVLLRLCEGVRDGNGSKDGDSFSAIASLLDAMAGHEHYCAYLGVLLRLYEKVRNGNGSKDGDSFSTIASLLDAMADHEQYCAFYSSKVQSRVGGLLLTLAESLRYKEHDIPVTRSEGQSFTALDMSKKNLHRLIAATSRRMRKEFPEMLTYLLSEKVVYCSHVFANLHLTSVVDHAILLMCARCGNAEHSATLPAIRGSMRIVERSIITARDYPFRPQVLEDFPLYFFIAACGARSHLNEHSMDWVALVNR